jgi:two-component system, NtrC family, response regulator AtoC
MRPCAISAELQHSASARKPAGGPEHVKPNILIVDDEPVVRRLLGEGCAAAGYATIEAATAAAGLEALEAGIDLVLLDYSLPDANGIEVLKRIKARDAEIPVIMMTAYSSLDRGIEAIRQRAFHYLSKPFEAEKMMLYVGQALEMTRLRRELRAYREAQHQEFAIDRLIGESAAMCSVKQTLRKIVNTGATTVLLTGESGTGKDLVAKVIHFNSARAPRPFLNITCSALPDPLLESELFGHERGAFTDANRSKRGLLEQASGGTIFLDEIGEMTPRLQAKVLRFIEEKTFKRVGGGADIRIDVRIVAATNRDLQESVRRGAFREDLFYRLRVVHVDVPPLRARMGDIRRLVAHYIRLFNAEFKKNVSGVTPEAMRVLEAHAWPGNVRELRNAIERGMLRADSAMLTTEDLHPLASAEVGFELPPEGVHFEKLERELVRQAIVQSSGNQTQAAALLGLNRDQIRYRIQKYGLHQELARAAHTKPAEILH